MPKITFAICGALISSLRSGATTPSVLYFFSETSAFLQSLLSAMSTPAKPQLGNERKQSSVERQCNVNSQHTFSF